MPRPAVAIGRLHLDEDGVLLIIIQGPSNRWRSIAFQDFVALSEEERGAMYEIRIEAIDTRGGTLLASEVMSGDEAIRTVGALQAGTRMAARHSFDEAMLPQVEIDEYALTAR